MNIICEGCHRPVVHLGGDDIKLMLVRNMENGLFQPYVNSDNLCGECAAHLYEAMEHCLYECNLVS